VGRKDKTRTQKLRSDHARSEIPSTPTRQSKSKFNVVLPSRTACTTSVSQSAVVVFSVVVWQPSTNGGPAFQECVLR
jgi:hypothetical protein